MYQLLNVLITSVMSQNDPTNAVDNFPRLAKCRQISIFAMPVVFTGEIMETTGKYD